MKPKILKAKEIKEALAGLPEWSYKQDKLTRVYAFADFRTALTFMVKAAFDADAMDHHPEWTNVYDKVTVKLNTHSVGGKVTELDAKLAWKLDRVAAQLGEGASATG